MNDHPTHQNQDDACGQAAAPGSPEAFSALMDSIRALGPQDRQLLQERADGAEVGFDAYALGQEYLERGDWAAAQRWLRIADRHGVPGAADDLDYALLSELAELGRPLPETSGEPWSFFTTLPQPFDLAEPDGRVKPACDAVKQPPAGLDAHRSPVYCSTVPASRTTDSQPEVEVEVSGATEDADRILTADAQKQAEKILAEARQEAEEIRANARRQAAPLADYADTLLEEFSSRSAGRDPLALIAKAGQVLLVLDNPVSLQSAGPQREYQMLRTALWKACAAKPEPSTSLLKACLDFHEARRWRSDPISSQPTAIERAIDAVPGQRFWETCTTALRGSFIHATKIKALMDIDVICQLSWNDEPTLWKPRAIELLDAASVPRLTALWHWRHRSASPDDALSEPTHADHAHLPMPGGRLHDL